MSSVSLSHTDSDQKTQASETQGSRSPRNPNVSELIASTKINENLYVYGPAWTNNVQDSVSPPLPFDVDLEYEGQKEIAKLQGMNDIRLL